MPFWESKEIVGGFALIDVASKDEAIAWTSRFLRIAGDGESTIREYWGPGDELPSFEAGGQGGASGGG